MEHLMMKAATTASTDQGTFSAVISAASVDRERDVVDAAGMVKALQKWVPTGKMIPLAWNHSSAAEDQIGYIDPSTAKAVDGEVVVDGQIDLDTGKGAHAWRLVKAGTLGFSFGYLVLDGSKRKGGGRNITELDVFEITATPTPMNNDTRVLDYKATETTVNVHNPPDAVRDVADAIDRAVGDRENDVEALRKRADAAALDAVVGDIDTEPTASEPQKKDLPPGAEWLFPASELDAARLGELKAVWTTAFVNNLPDSAFLYVEPGGDKDSDGKTVPRSLRHFPYKDPSGSVDLPHLRNALARIPQSDLGQDIKDKLTAKAQAILADQKAVDVTGKEPRARSVDPLRKQADALALEVLSDGESLRKPPPEKVTEPKPKPAYSLAELKQKSRDETLMALSGVEEL